MFKSSDDTIKTGGTSFTNFSTIFSLMLVLFMLGLLGIILFEAKKLSDYFKENIIIMLEIRDDAPADSVKLLANQINGEAYVKELKFVSRDQAAEKLKADLGEDFITTLGSNPLFDSYELYVKANFANSDSINMIQERLSQNPVIREVYYQESLVDTINKNVKTIGIILGSIVLVFLIIAVNIIYGTLRWNVYSNRFLVKSMQLIGATNSFIKWPFIKQSLINGMIAGVIAVTLLNIVLVLLGQALPEFNFHKDLLFFVIWFCIVFALGVIISWLSSSRALNKFLAKKLDDLY